MLAQVGSWTITATHDDGEIEEYDEMSYKESIEILDALARDEGVAFIYMLRSEG